MKFTTIRNVVATALLGLTAIGGIFASSAGASVNNSLYWLHHGDYACSLKPTADLMTDWDMATYHKPGSDGFRASWSNERPKGKWEDSYFIDGWNRDYDSTWCDNYRMPDGGWGKAPVLQYVDNSTVRANFSAHGSGRLGFDLWFSANPSEVTATQLQHDRRTYEVMVQPGKGIRKDNPGWHRVYIGAGGRASNVVWWDMNLTSIAKRAGVPGWYKWASIGAGGETPSGEFAVTNYYLNITR